jgi:hypothetical protein
MQGGLGARETGVADIRRNAVAHRPRLTHRLNAPLCNQGCQSALQGAALQGVVLRLQEFVNAQAVRGGGNARNQVGQFLRGGEARHGEGS